MAATSERKFDVVLSFAAPERAYAQAIHAIGVANGVRVFLDEEFQHEIWGKNLVEYLDRTYREGARYCVMLVSASYRASAYGTVERRAAFDRMLEATGDYILPVRVDDTKMDGLANSTAYADLRTSGVLGVCELLVRKIDGRPAGLLAIPDGCRIPRVPRGAFPAEHLRVYFKRLLEDQPHIVFGVLVYDESCVEVRKMFRDRDCWDALDKASGSDFEVFAVRDETDSSVLQSVELMTAASLGRSRDRARYFSRLLKQHFGEEARLVYPSMLLFVAAGGNVTHARLIPLGRGKTVEQTFQRIQGLIEEVATAVAAWRGSGQGADALWPVLKGRLLASDYTVYIQRAPRDAGVTIDELTRFVESP